MQQQKQIHNWVVDQPADSIEFCNKEQFHNFFVCGTYQLHQSELQQSQHNYRTGSIILYDLNSLNFENNSNQQSIEKLQTICGSGVLDLKWNASNSNLALLAAARSCGLVDILKLNEHNKLDSIQQLNTHEDDCGLGLAVDWVQYSTTEGLELASCYSSGNLATWQRASDGSLILNNFWKAHNHECWVVCWQNNNNNDNTINQNKPILWSGADDMYLKCWDLRTSTEFAVLQKRFDMGITAIQFTKENEFNFIVGSYSQRVYLFDNRMIRNSICECDVGGGVWRLKWCPIKGNENLISCASMYNGFHILDCNLAAKEINIVSHYNQNHSSIGYGIDWCFRNYTNNYKAILASCSFYDNSCSIWTI
eukprot:TRINITY_DN133_c1_g1_i1.p1 TRINITY_DN133_c1_g1~~TRINITY_DN133_c1_g1_i1.p1  ORF type:complete len:365 (-),score=143.38 TRINITY_DN133_c1_g1_i1:8-1102(-)